MVTCLLRAGFSDEARAWRDWLLRAVAGMPSQVQPIYGIAGEHRLNEWEVPWLPGFGGARPVRVGNAAFTQFQLDVYGEVMNALHFARQAHISPSEAGWHLRKALLDHLGTVWGDPDEGIWEVRGGRQHFVHSRVMAWVEFDRAIRAAEEFHLEGPVGQWKSLRDRIRRTTRRKEPKGPKGRSQKPRSRGDQDEGAGPSPSRQLILALRYACQMRTL
jgi:Glucoamylase and related glycosyl hydrolases